MTPATQFTIRPATTTDIPVLETLIEQSVRQLQAGDYSPTQIDASIGSVFGIDRQLLADQTYFVASPMDDPGILVACGGWSYRRTLYGSDQHTERNAAQLDPATGTLVLAHCEAAASAAGFTRFEMGSTLTGVPLYKLKGYAEHSRVDVPLPNGEALEVVVMEKRI